MTRMNSVVVQTGVILGGDMPTDCINVENSVAGNQLMFTCPPSKKGVVIEVFQKCYDGTCSCKHYIGGKLTQIKPCRVASCLFKNGNSSLNENDTILQWGSGRV